MVGLLTGKVVHVEHGKAKVVMDDGSGIVTIPCGKTTEVGDYCSLTYQLNGQPGRRRGAPDMRGAPSAPGGSSSPPRGGASLLP